MTCPQCREQGVFMPVQIQSVSRGTETVLEVSCARCGWCGRYDTG